jgi:hypothetical protein|tara:strand:- start:1389 stop:1565 length:177 start_codon:yes stop_codon:yes gene_type:complete
VVAVGFNFPYPLVAGLFGILPFTILWMVYKILKDGEHSGKTFEKHFLSLSKVNVLALF